jgi:hypothetical protein
MKLVTFLLYITMVNSMTLYSLLTVSINCSMHIAFKIWLESSEKKLATLKSLGVFANFTCRLPQGVKRKLRDDGSCANFVEHLELTSPRCLPNDQQIHLPSFPPPIALSKAALAHMPIAFIETKNSQQCRSPPLGKRISYKD